MKRIILIVLGVIVALGILGVVAVKMFPQLAIVPVIKIKYSEEKWPALYGTPIERGAVARGTGKGVGQYEKFGVAFEMPLNPVSSNEKKDVVQMKFSETKTIVVMGQIADPFAVGKEQLLKKEIKDAFEDIYGSEVLRSAYGFRELILNTTPEQMRIGMAKNKAAADSILVILKTVGASFTNEDGSPKKVFKFSNATIEGFQHGDPQSSPDTVIIEFIKKGEEKGRQLLVSGMTQEEIDVVLSTLTLK